MHIRQAELAALEAIGEAFVIDAEAMENRGLEVVDVHGILQGIEAEIIRATESHTGLDTAAGHPDREGLAVMVASVLLTISSTLGVRGASELAAPDDEGVVEHAALLEVLDQRGRGLVDVAGHLG